MSEASSLKGRIEADVKAALRNRDKQRVSALRLAVNAIQQREIDERRALDDSEVLAVLDKLIKQRHESAEQYAAAGRTELAEGERYEAEALQAYLPEALSEAELEQLIDAAIAESGAASIKDMGRVMGLLKPKVQGRADMGAVSGAVKKRLGGG